MEIFDSVVTLIICFQCKLGFLNLGEQNRFMFFRSEEEKMEDGGRGNFNTLKIRSFISLAYHFSARPDGIAQKLAICIHSKVSNFHFLK